MRGLRQVLILATLAAVLGGWGINNPSGDIQPLGGGSGGSSTDPNAVHLTGPETITGVKTFSVSPVVPDASFAESATTNLVSDLAAKATDSLTCHLAGTETITGAKTFSAPILQAAGTAVAPSYAFTGNPNFGMYMDNPNSALMLAANGMGAIFAKRDATNPNFVDIGINMVPQLGVALSIRTDQNTSAQDAIQVMSNNGTSQLFRLAYNGSITAFNQVGLNNNGTVGAPSLKMGTSGASGLYNVTTNVVGFITAGIKAGSIDATQNWVVGNPNGGNYLQVGAGTADSAGTIYLGDQGSANAIKIVKNGAGASVLIQSGSGGPANVFSGTYNFGGGTDTQLWRSAANVLGVGNQTTPASVLAGAHTIPKTTNYTIPTTGVENGAHYTTTGAAGSVQFTITPAAEAYYKFTATAAQTMTVVASSGSLFGPGSLTGATRTINAGTAAIQYSSFDLACDATNCYVRAISGTVL